ncbi:MAG: DUF4333 domain-containing protein [Bowdeniella nasicola]|nr:DUF4333 domain-containing protein [Bowdeniella nasicola]
MKRIQRVGAALAVMALLGACSSRAVAPVEAEDLQARIAQSVAEQLGEPPAVQCPTGLAAEVGAETTCSISGGSEPLIATAKVTEVDETSGDVTIAVSVSSEATPEQRPMPQDESPAEKDSPADDATESESDDD